MGPTAATTEVEKDVDGGGTDGDPGEPTINIKNINGGAPGRC
jgi:hypothetical protein